MDNNSQKTPLAQSLQKFGRAKAQDAVQTLGKGLPCTIAEIVSPGVVKVNFAVQASPAALAQTTMPVCKTRYIDYPLTVGDIGVALSADLRTGGLTGLGTGTPKLYDTVGNLSALTFFPLGFLSEVSIDPAALVLFSNIVCTPTELAFYGGSKVTKQTVSGALSAVTDANAKAVLTSLIAALTAMNLIQDGTS